MCTVTVFPIDNDGFVLTSNRDESPLREPKSPDYYQGNDARLLYPKDKISNGTWIGATTKNRVLCLLNGGFEKHKRELPYRQSRGKVVTDLLEYDEIEMAIENYNFKNIEPFTLVIVDWNHKLTFYQLVWDGLEKHFKQLPLTTHIWSSSTLYTEQMREERMQWFSEFLENNNLSAENILKFHNPINIQNEEYGIIMDRGFVKTTSTTQVIKNDDVITMNFYDFHTGKRTLRSLPLSSPVNE